MNRKFQNHAGRWALYCFDRNLVFNVAERNYRLLEEALEVVQSRALSRAEAHALVDFVFDKPAGDPKSEVGDLIISTAVVCHTAGYDMTEVAEDALARCWKNVDRIKAKQGTKLRFSPSCAAGPAPIVPPPSIDDLEEGEYE